MIQLVLGVTFVVCLVLAILVFAGSSAKMFARNFFLLICICFLLWIVGIYWFLFTDNTQNALVAAKIFYAAAIVFPPALFVFSLFFPNSSIKSPAIVLAPVALVTVAMLGMIIFDNHFIINDVTYASSVQSVVIDPLSYLTFATFFVTFFIAAIVASLRRAFMVRGNDRAQTRLFTVGIIATSIPGFYANLYLPFFNQYQHVWIGPVAVIIFVAFIAYGIIKHSMFDVRLAVVRTVAYIFTLASLGLIYYGLAYVLSALLFKGQISEGVSFSPVNISLALFLAIIFQPFKKLFDRITNKVFFRNDYNPQKALDEVGAIVAKQIQLQPLLRDSLNIIRKTLNPSSASFLLVDSDLHVGHVQGLGIAKDVEGLLPSLSRCKRQLIVATTEIPESPGLHDMLDAAGASVVIRLDTANRIGGYLILADKLNGLAYSRRDLDFLSVMTDELAVAIENAQRYEEIQAFNKTLQVKVDEATTELKASNHKLHELDKTKDEFISMASHQLRTPLTTIKGYISMLLDGDAGEVTDQQRKLLEEAFNSSQRMVYLIGDFLNVSRIQTGKFAIELAPCNLSNILDEEIEQLQVMAKSRQLDLTYDKVQNFPTVEIDENKIRQVMMNFIDNAIYYSKPDGKIRIVLSYDRDHIEFKVIDNGIGVPKAEQHKLFTKFTRASNARRQRPDGTGIGLFMAKKVIVALGGSIIFKSEEGKGSTFGFSLNR